MSDFQIIEMHQHHEGFFVATVRSLRTQEEFVVHNRWSAWFGGDPEIKQGAHMKDLRHDLCASLQARKHEVEKGINKIANNPFVNLSANPFMAAK